MVPRPAIPTDEELVGLAEYYFPLRDELVVTVCDYPVVEDNRIPPVDIRVITLKDLDQCMYDL